MTRYHALTCTTASKSWHKLKKKITKILEIWNGMHHACMGWGRSSTVRQGREWHGVYLVLLNWSQLVTVNHCATVAKHNPTVTKVASPGTFPELLRRSRFASFDPTIRQSYGTPPSRLHRGNGVLNVPSHNVNAIPLSSKPQKFRRTLNITSNGTT